jgi:hypothetical protein
MRLRELVELVCDGVNVDGHGLRLSLLPVNDAEQSRLTRES